MTVTRRNFLRSAALGLGALSTGALSRRARARDGDSIKVGVLVDLSGPLQVYGTGKARCIQLAVDEINARGGLLGRQLEIVQYDTQSQNQLYGQFAQQLALRDRVAVVHGAVTSAAREVARPVLDRARTLYFYNMEYEGGLCDRNTFVTGPTAQQMLIEFIPHIIERFGPRLYVLAADYNFGHYSTEWVKKIAAEAGGTVIASEFFPLDVSTFGPTIGKIQKAGPDAVFNIFVGPAHGSFYGQWAAAGMNRKIPMASQTLGGAGEHKRMPPEVSEGLITVKNYFDELQTPANQAFLARFTRRFGSDYGYLGPLSIADYQAMYLWAEAVTRAGSIEREPVIEALESGIAIDGPSGRVALEPRTHHAVLDMYLGEVNDGAFRVQRKWEQVPPMPGDQRCNLRANPNTNQQFAPQV